MLSQAKAEALEALSDERIGRLPDGTVPAEIIEELEVAGYLRPSERERVCRALAERAADRRIEWASRSVAQGDVLASFARYCREDLPDVDVVSEERGKVVVRWRDEVSRLELRNGFVAVELLASDTPTMLLGDIEPRLDELVAVFLDRPEVRSRLAVCDLGRLERLGTVRSSAFVYFEWFLRDAYGVKVVPVPAFTQGLIDRGVISLGMG